MLTVMNDEEMDQMEEELSEGIAEAYGCPDSCRIELDGVCPHGYTSLAMSFGMI